jgi:predicted outer membrane protein
MAAVTLGLMALTGCKPVEPDPQSSVQTETGPIGPGDVDLLTKVRQASLWEMPAGDMARQRAKNAKLREIGETIMVDHGRLDVAVRQVSAQLGVALPSEPTNTQRIWLRQLQDAKDGPEFDHLFVDLLRQAHGTVFAAIAQVRAGTRNSVVRDFATTSNQVVLRHITLLESSGLVDFNALPDPIIGGSALDLDPGDFLLAGGIALGEILLTIFLIGLLKRAPKRAPRSGGRGRRRAAEADIEADDGLPVDPFLTRT